MNDRSNVVGPPPVPSHLAPPMGPYVGTPMPPAIPAGTPRFREEFVSPPVSPGRLIQLTPPATEVPPLAAYLQDAMAAYELAVLEAVARLAEHPRDRSRLQALSRHLNDDRERLTKAILFTIEHLPRKPQ